MNDWWKIYGSILAGALVLGATFWLGKYYVVNHCEEYGAYRVNEGKGMLCVVKPLVPYGQGDLDYLRPNGKKVVKLGKTI